MKTGGIYSVLCMLDNVPYGPGTLLPKEDKEGRHNEIVAKREAFDAHMASIKEQMDKSGITNVGFEPNFVVTSIGLVGTVENIKQAIAFLKETCGLSFKRISQPELAIPPQPRGRHGGGFSIGRLTH